MIQFEPPKILFQDTDAGAKKTLVSALHLKQRYPFLLPKDKMALKVIVEFEVVDGTRITFEREHPFEDRELTERVLLEKILNHYNVQ